MNKEIKEKMTIGKAKKILRGFLEKDCYYDTPLYYAIPYLLDHITNLQQKIKHYEETTTFGDYVKEVNLLVDYKSRIEKAAEFINKNKSTITQQRADFYNCDELRNRKLKVGTFMWNVDELIDILNGEDND